MVWGGLKLISVAPASPLPSFSCVLQTPSSARLVGRLGPPWLHRVRERAGWTLFCGTNEHAVMCPAVKLSRKTHLMRQCKNRLSSADACAELADSPVMIGCEGVGCDCLWGVQTPPVSAGTLCVLHQWQNHGEKRSAADINSAQGCIRSESTLHKKKNYISLVSFHLDPGYFKCRTCTI